MTGGKKNSDTIHIKAILQKLVSKWYYFVIAFAVMLSLAVLYIRLADKVYLVKATILLKGKPMDLTSSNDYLKGLGFFSPVNTEVEDEIGIITSRAMIEKTISKLSFDISCFVKENFLLTRELYDDIPFAVEADFTKPQMTGIPVYIEQLGKGRHRIAFKAKDPVLYNFASDMRETHTGTVELDTVVVTGSSFTSAYLSFRIFFNDDFHQEGKTFFVINDPRSVVENYHGKLDVRLISRESSMVELTIKDKNPRKQEQFLNALLDTYLESEIIRKNHLGLKIVDFIDSQIGTIADSLKRVEGSLESFRARNNVVDIPTTSENLVQKLDELHSEKSKLNVKLRHYMKMPDILETLKDYTAISTNDMNDPLLSNLLIELSRLYQEKASLDFKTRLKNPFVAELDARIESTRKSLRENIRSMIDATRIAINEIEQRIGQAQATLNRLPRNERELTNIKRKFEFSDNVYNFLLEKRAEVGIAIASNTSDKMIVDRAGIVGNGPVSPDAGMAYVLGIVLGFLLPVGFIVAKDFLNDHIMGREDVEDLTDIPVMGIVVHGGKKERAFFSKKRRSRLTESFRSLGMQYQYLIPGEGSRVVGITSYGEKEGKTFCAIHLAMALAHLGKKTLILDTDIYKPQVAEQLHLDNRYDLSDFLEGKNTQEEIIQCTHIDNLEAIALRAAPQNPATIAGQSRFEELIGSLRLKYDSIILDSPPIGFTSDYMLMMKYADTHIYIIRSGHTDKYSLHKINRLYQSSRIKNAGIILNDVKSYKYNGYTYGSYA